MARIRTIKPEFFRHEGLFEAEQETGFPLRVAFAGLWTAADREGRFKWRPRELKLDCLPHDQVDFSRVLDALATRGFIVKYAIGSREFGHIPSWSDHQVINNRESQSDIPPPIENKDLTREARVDDATATPLMQDQGERKGKEGERKGKDSDADASARAIDRKKVSRSLPDDFGLSSRVAAYATSLGLSTTEISREHAKFCNHAKQTDRRCAEWEPAEETWMIGAAERLGKSPQGETPAQIDWEVVLSTFKLTGHWSRYAGPDPGSPACRAPPQFLEKHGLRSA